MQAGKQLKLLMNISGHRFGNKETLIYIICNNCKIIITNTECLKSVIRIRLKENAEETILKNCKLQVYNYQIFFTGLCDECRKSL